MVLFLFWGFLGGFFAYFIIERNSNFWLKVNKNKVKTFSIQVVGSRWSISSVGDGEIRGNWNRSAGQWSRGHQVGEVRSFWSSSKIPDGIMEVGFFGS